MARMSREERARMEGFSYAIRKLEEGKTLEDLQAEAKMRGVYGLPIDLTMAEVDRFGEKVKKKVIENVLLMTCSVLQDEYGFGTKRIDRFMERFNGRTSAIKFNYVTWGDISKQLSKELGIQFEVTEG